MAVRKTRKNRTTRKSGGSRNFIVSYTKFQVKNQEFPRNLATKQPTFQFQSDPGRLYSLVMHDPDAPAAKIQGGSWLHFLATNLESGSLQPGNIQMPYAPPTPPPGSGVHRYLFELYEQPGTVEIDPLPERSPFFPELFAQMHGLRKVASRQFRVKAPKN